jgi:CRP/FNR family transcriptional regulator
MNAVQTVVEFPQARFQASMPPSAASIDIDLLRRHVRVLRRKVLAGEYIYRSGQSMQAVFLVHVGSVKTCELAADGREQISGFRMRGDLVGVESIGLAVYACDAIALEDTEIWELPYPPVLAACLEIPQLQQCFTAALVGEIRRDRAWMLAVGTLTADQRVAAFLLDVAARHSELGFSARHFILRMSRADMANFLALKHETVSRALSRLQDLNCISVQRRELKVLDTCELQKLASRPATVH